MHIHGYLDDDDQLWDFLRDIVARRDATRENEAARGPQVIAGAGLRAAIVEPLCISRVMFTDQDDASAAVGLQPADRRVLLDANSRLWDTWLADAKGDDELDDDESD